MLRRRGDDYIGKARRMALPSRAVGDGTGYPSGWVGTSKARDTVAIQVTDGFLSHDARFALLRAARSRRNFAIPSSISATVTTDRNNEAEWASIHSIGAPTEWVAWATQRK